MNTDTSHMAKRPTEPEAPSTAGTAMQTCARFDSAHDDGSSSGFQSLADRVEIEALRAEFTDAAMMRDYDRVASLFTADGAWRIPDIPIDLVGQKAISAWAAQVPEVVQYLVQTAHPGTILLDGNTASGRVFIHELGSARDGRSGENYAIYHDRYQRTLDGWRFTERVYEIRYLDRISGVPLGCTAACKHLALPGVLVGGVVSETWTGERPMRDGPSAVSGHRVKVTLQRPPIKTA